LAQKAQADALEQAYGADRVRSDLADLFLHLERQHAGVDRHVREERRNELLVLHREPIRFAERQAGDPRSIALPKAALSLDGERRLHLRDHVVGEALAVEREVEKADERELRAEALGMSPQVRIDDQAAHLGRTVHRVAQMERGVAEHLSQGLRVPLVVHHLEEVVGRVGSPVLGDDHRATGRAPGASILCDEHVVSIGRVVLSGERAARPRDQLAEVFAPGRQIDRVENPGQS
jgi:hypothetical protein